MARRHRAEIRRPKAGLRTAIAPGMNPSRTLVAAPALLLSLLAAGPGCLQPASEPEPGASTLRVVKTLTAEHPIAGVDSDGQGGLWLAYQIDRGYPAANEVSVIHLSSSGERLSQWRYEDESTTARGLAVGAGAVWLNYNDLGGHNHVRKLDPETGRVLASFATEDGVVDLEVDGEVLMQSSVWNQVIASRAADGVEQWRTSFAGIESWQQRGLAAAGDGRLWLADAGGNRILYFAPGTAQASSYPLARPGVVADSRGLAWDGAQLVMATQSQLLWLAPGGAATGWER